MLILSRVCAAFRNKSGEIIFKITPSMRLTFQEAPDAIRQDPLFQMLKNDRSIEVTDDIVRRKQLENDPETLPEKIQEDPAPVPENKKTTKKATERKDESA